MDVFANVEGGIGFLGGIVTVRMPYENCTRKVAPPVSPVSYCQLRYESEAASLRGQILDFHCGSGVPGAEVVLTETTGDYRRSTLSNRDDGSYSIGALIPGMVYDYRITQVGFQPLVGSLSLAVGERAIQDFSLRRDVNHCPSA